MSTADEKLPVQVGDVLAGKYRVERVLGVGGMGVVVAAKHLQLDQMVALKFLLPTAIESSEAVERFLREAKAAVRLKSEHVAKVTDVGTLDSGAPYMVMEYLAGSDLSQVVAASGKLTLEEAVSFVLQACEAIAEAHSLGIIHRDLKPQNLFVTRRVDGRPLIKVLDFGISKSIDTAGGLSLTRTSSIMGSPLYMSPEQMRSSKNVDQRSDIWGLGVILYELLTGRVPFEAEAIPELCLKVVQDAPAPPRSLRPEVSEDLNAVVLKCLEKSVDARFQNVAELAGALEPHAAELSRGVSERVASTLRVPSRPPMASVGSTARNPKVGTGGTAWGATQPFPGAQRRRTAILVAAAVGAFTVIGGVVVLVASHNSTKTLGSEPTATATATTTATATATTTATATATATVALNPGVSVAVAPVVGHAAARPSAGPSQARKDAGAPAAAVTGVPHGFKRVMKARALITALGVAIAAASGPAWAQENAEKVAAARALFDQAQALMQDKKFGDACSKFRASNDQVPRPVTLLNLAECYEKNEQNASAWATYNDAIGLCRKQNRPELEELAKKKVADLEPTLLKLTIVVPTAVLVDGLVVTRDKVKIDSGGWGAPLPVDPGKHVIEATAPKKLPWSKEVELPAVDRVEVEKLKDAPVEAPIVKTEIVTKVVETPSFLTPLRAAGIVVGSLGLASLIGGSVTGGVATSTWASAKTDCGAGNIPNNCDPAKSGPDEADRAKTLATVSTVLFGVGAGGVALGVVLFVVGKPSRPDAPAASGRVWPLVGLGWAGVGGLF